MISADNPAVTNALLTSAAQSPGEWFDVVAVLGTVTRTAGAPFTETEKVALAANGTVT